MALHREAAYTILAQTFHCTFPRNLATLQDDADYICGNCGEQIVIPVDLSAGPRQEYVEDCPVCCCANIIHLEIDESGDATASAQLE